MKKNKLLPILSLFLVLCLLPAISLADANNKPIPVLTEDEITATPSGIHHYLMICMDCWGTDMENLEHTDGLVLVTVDEYTGRIMLTSFARDILIQRWDGKFGRINNVATLYQDELQAKKESDTGRRAIEELVSIINSHFNVEIEKYVVVDFKEVQDIVDVLGGVDVTLTSRECARLRSFGIDIPQQAGTYHLEGYSAVIYMRIRKVYFEYVDEFGETHHLTQEMARARRANIVLTTIAGMLSDITEDEAWDLVDKVLENTILTNLTLDDLIQIVQIAMEVKGGAVDTITMPIEDAYEESESSGMMIKELDWEKNREALEEFMYADDFSVRD